jgi:ribosome-associated translation inhibitor RaiA
MTQIVFKNLEKSELAKEAVEAQIDGVKDRFPKLSDSKMVVTLSMDNSPRQAGPDLFRVKLRIERGVYHGVIMEKTAPNLYHALSELGDGLLERLNRHSDKIRVQNRRVERS